ncbi:MAG TPA: efflux RND transporter permease subunit, partial [Candidatus Xenobia bacterium]
MSLSAIFIQRPVMTTLLMLGITVFGILGWRTLPVNQLPNIDFPSISISAALPGADPETMAATVAAPLERQFTTISGIDEMSSSSSLGSTSISLVFNLNRDIDSAAQDVQSAISAALPLLPQLPTRPSFRKVNPTSAPILYLNLRSDTMPLSAVDEYAENVLAQRLSMVTGVAQVTVFGSQKYAVRVQVDPDKLADKGIGLDQVNSALAAGNVKLPTGSLYGPHTYYSVQSNDQLFKAADYRPLIVAYKNGRPVRLEEVADVLDSVENDKTYNVVSGNRAITLAVQRQPNTNTVQVIDDCKAVLASFEDQIPKALHLAIMYDRSVSIRADVDDVTHTMFLTVGLVILVIFLFLRNGTATLIPSLALPVSLIGTLAAMALLNFSLDDMSLMGMTLCVGLLVDDAIVML